MHKEKKMAFPAIYHKITSIFSEVIGHIKMIVPLKAICLLLFRVLDSQSVKNHHSGMRPGTRVENKQ